MTVFLNDHDFTLHVGDNRDIELNLEYAEMAGRRLQQLSLLAEDFA
jgi:hypothetical protein